MKNPKKNKSSTQKIFRGTQWKFTFILSGVTAVLLAVSFIAIYLFTTMSNRLAVADTLKQALELCAKYELEQKDITDGKEIESTVSIDDFHQYDCMLISVRGTVDAENYEIITYDVTAKYNVDASTDERAEEIESLEAVLLEAAKNNSSYVPLTEASTLGKTYVCEIYTDTETLKLPKKEEDDGKGNGGKQDDPDEPIEPIDPNDPSTYESVSIYHRSYALYDYTKEQSTLTSLTIVLVVVLLVALLFVFILGYIISGWTLAPAREAYARQKTLIANASHELKTPVTIINANLDVLSSNKDTAVGENTKWLNNIEDQTKRMNDLIIEMLELSSFESAQYVPELKVMDLSRELEGLVLSFEAACFERNIALDVSIRPSVVGTFDSKGLTKLALILLDNAVKYCNDNGNIVIKLRTKKKAVVLSVANTGERIPPETMSKLFERFYKSGGASKSFGLGLSMAKTITENMHGSIACTSDDNFTTFTVVLPL